MLLLPTILDPSLPRLIKAGRVGVVPTDTIYGLAAAAANRQAVARLYRLKKREQKPGTVIAASLEQLTNLGLDKESLDRAQKLWPNPISVVVPSPPALGYLDQGVGSLAVRIPADEGLRTLLAKTGPLLTSSANHPGEPPANNFSEARAYFGDRVGFYVDGGDLSGRPPSTVARYLDGRLEVLRQGAVKIDW